MPKISVIDQTIREGMQYRGLMFSPHERAEILDFQETLGVDICQGGYPPAHDSETRCVERLHRRAKEKKYHIRVAGLGRALMKDISPMADSGLGDFHLHLNINNQRSKSCGEDLKPVKEIVSFLRETVSKPCIGLSILDIGKTPSATLKPYCEYLINRVKIDMLTLPDTSGIMAPDVLYQRIGEITRIASGTSTRIGIHCHNDMGMASANTVMGIAAGATVVEATALGIGERNGIGDLFLVGRTLKNQGYDINLDTDNTEGFEAYYRYVDRICLKKTGESMMNYNTPFFGDAMKTHVAGTHADISYGLKDEKAFFINVLCGKKLISEHLDLLKIDYNRNDMANIVRAIKAKSVKISQSLNAEQIRAIVRQVSGSGI